MQQNIKSELELLFTKVKGKVFKDYNIGKLTFFKTGGNAEYLYIPSSIADLQFFLKNVPKTVPIFILGFGSNLLVREGGVKGVVIKLSNLLNIEVNGNYITAEGGVFDKTLANFAKEKGLSGLEFLYNIPGSIGGAVFMNAGAYGYEIKDVFEKGKAITLNGDIVNLEKNKNISFLYRKSVTQNHLIFLKATFKCTPKNSEDIEKVMKNMEEIRKKTQPYNIKTAGSTFTNPSNSEYKAWQLVEAVDGKNLNINGARVSRIHANFLENTGTASATDIENLGNLIIEKVFYKFGITLKWELKIIGEFK